MRIHYWLCDKKVPILDEQSGDDESGDDESGDDESGDEDDDESNEDDEGITSTFYWCRQSSIILTINIIYQWIITMYCTV